VDRVHREADVGADIVEPPMSATSRREQLQQRSRLFDHLIGAGENRRRNFEAEHLGVWPIRIVVLEHDVEVCCPDLATVVCASVHTIADVIQRNPDATGFRPLQTGCKPSGCLGPPRLGLGPRASPSHRQRAANAARALGRRSDCCCEKGPAGEGEEVQSEAKLSAANRDCLKGPPITEPPYWSA
jgi:hypothetical protein